MLLLALLAVMLPVRGVMAAAMHCPPPAVAGEGHSMPMGWGMAPAEAGHHADVGTSPHAEAHHAEADHAEADHVHAAYGVEGGHHPHESSGAESCTLCSACCSVPPFPAAAPSVPLPHVLAAVVFSSLSAPATRFLSDGQERPPRSI